MLYEVITYAAPFPAPLAGKAQTGLFLSAVFGIPQDEGVPIGGALEVSPAYGGLEESLPEAPFFDFLEFRANGTLDKAAVFLSREFSPAVAPPSAEA